MKPGTLLFSFVLLVSSAQLFGQGCCGGGSGSPIAGGASQGVLQDRQMEINSNYQYVNTNRFYNSDSRDTAFYFDSFSSQYVYTRVAYGVTKDFTMSVETGYWINKTQVGLHKVDTITSSGFGDLILFPRYDIINHTSENKRVELTLGLGMKIPLGSYNDSVGYIEQFSGNIYYVTKPLSVQTSSGANDFIGYVFFYRGFPDNNFRIFANSFYIRKGWNPVGEKMGDFATIGLFAGKTFFKKLGVTLGVRGEWIDQMKLNETVYLYNYPTYDPEATGSKKVMLMPQVSFNFTDNLTLYTVSEIPLYQYVTKNQVGSALQLTAGISYRFLTYKVGHSKANGTETGNYQCSMKCEGKVFTAPGKCPICGMDLEVQK
jgi:hypothetical protein